MGVRAVQETGIAPSVDSWYLHQKVNASNVKAQEGATLDLLEGMGVGVRAVQVTGTAQNAVRWCSHQKMFASSAVLGGLVMEGVEEVAQGIAAVVATGIAVVNAGAFGKMRAKLRTWMMMIDGRVRRKKFSVYNGGSISSC